MGALALLPLIVSRLVLVPPSRLQLASLATSQCRSLSEDAVGSERLDEGPESSLVDARTCFINCTIAACSLFCRLRDHVPRPMVGVPAGVVEIPVLSESDIMKNMQPNSRTNFFTPTRVFAARHNKISCNYIIALPW